MIRSKTVFIFPSPTAPHITLSYRNYLAPTPVSTTSQALARKRATVTNSDTGKEGEKKQTQAEGDKSKADDALDRALEDTFPASDPPSSVIKGTTSNPTPDEKKRDEAWHLDD